MALTKEAEYVLRTVEERGIRFIRLWFTDVLGFLKSFAITQQELEGAFAEGMGFDGSSIEGFARIQESDMVARPDPSTFQIIPWRSEEHVARMFCDIHNPDGTPFDGDPRYVLKRQLKRASELGFTFYVGPELEYFYFKDSAGTEFLDHGGYFDLTPLDVATDYRKRTVQYLEAMGIPVVANQWVNACKRLVPGYEAPVYVCWARRNRSALVRVPMYKPGKESATRVEFRSPDPACNPYLAFAAMLAAGLAGIEGEYELPPEASNNIYEMTEEERRTAGIQSLPEDLYEAIRVAEGSKVMRDCLGEHVHEYLIRNKRNEWDSYKAYVTPYELERYLPIL